jgi:type I restriction enzyme R subunit
MLSWSQPTFRYSLLDGVKDGFLINPIVVDARSEVTTQLLSDDGFVVEFKDDEGEDQKEAFQQREFEKRFFSDATNQISAKPFLKERPRLRRPLRPHRPARPPHGPRLPRGK